MHCTPHTCYLFSGGCAGRPFIIPRPLPPTPLAWVERQCITSRGSRPLTTQSLNRYNSTSGKDVHDRTQLSLWESDAPWGPWKHFHRDDDWRGPDGSSGGYTPVFPPAWIEEEKMWMSFTQCCPDPSISPRNNYNYTLQSVTLALP